MIMKATPKALLRRVTGRATPRLTPVDTRPVITDVVPMDTLHVTESDGFTALYAAIDRASHVDVMASTRVAAMAGMTYLGDQDPHTMARIITEAGSLGATPLRAAIMRLAAIGRAQSANAAAAV